MTTARVVTADALPILDALDPGHYPAVFTSLPDAAETGMDMPTWREWFAGAVRSTVRVVDPSGVAVFYQTDRRHGGGVESKADLVMRSAVDAGLRVVWHKIAVTGRPGSTSLFRPAYTHLIAVSRQASAGKPTADVFTKGRKLYRDATDSAALAVGRDMIARTGADHVADPFCGRGSIAVAATEAGWDSTSVDIDAAQTADAARNVAAAGAVVVTS